MKHIEPRFMVYGVTTILFCFLLNAVVVLTMDRNADKTLLRDMLRSKDITHRTEEDYKAEFINKCLLARQVYQYSWYKTVHTKIGKVYAQGRRAMSLEEYNRLIEMSWECNRLLGMPYDSWLNYIPLSKWIIESSLNPKAEHRTGEVLKFTGYTEGGLRTAFMHYKYEMGIVKGHPLYIDGLFDSGLTVDDILRIINDKFENVIKFDYAYMLYLLKQYEFRYDFMLLAFHFGEGRTLYWWANGIRSVPSYRLDGGWKGYYLREYCQTVDEIAQGIALGHMMRISRWSEMTTRLSKQREIGAKYVATVRLKIKSEEDYIELDNKYAELMRDFDAFKELHIKLLNQMGELNDLTLEYERANERGAVEWAKKFLKEKVRPLRHSISSNYKNLKKVKK